MLLALMLGVAPTTAGQDQVEDTRKQAPAQTGALPAEVAEIARKVAHLPLAQRMQAISEPFLGMPYVVDAVGEGVEPDADPPARYDVFDCLTFVEEVLAIALSGDPAGTPWVRNQLRYKGGEPNYANRRHFMTHQWIPDNIANGWLEDVTAEYGETHLLTKDVSLKTWQWWKGRSRFALLDHQLPQGTFSLPLLSLDAAALAAEDIEPGTLVIVVRKSREYVPIVVTHLGFVIESDDVPRMRHATKMGDQRVRDERMGWYFEHLRWFDNWNIAGIQLLKPVDRGPRLGLLQEEADRLRGRTSPPAAPRAATSSP